MLTSLYDGAYYATVERSGWVFRIGAGSGIKRSGAFVFPEYRGLSVRLVPGEPPDAATCYFSLAHEFDLWIRPTYWSEEDFIESEDRKICEELRIPYDESRRR
jgi:hypothetical protein